MHGVFWLDRDAIAPFLNEKGEFDDVNVIELIEKWISCSLDTGNDQLDKIVREVNVHKHTKSCLKKSTNCRFNFPKLPSNKTIIACPLPEGTSEEEIEENEKRLNDSNKILKKVKEELTKLTEDEIHELYNNDLKTFLEALQIDIDVYHEALKISQKGKVVVLQRKLNERYVNNYNPLFLLAWNGNMDIQICLDPYAVVTYITDYLTKADSGLTSALKKAVQNSKESDDFERDNYLKKIYFTHKQVSVSEAAYRLIPGMHMKTSNSNCTFVTTGFPENRHRYLKKIPDSNGTALNEYEYEDNDNEIENEEMDEDLKECQLNVASTVKIKGRVGNFKSTVTIHEKYSNRPKQLQSMCLAPVSYTHLTLPTIYSV